MFVMGRGTEGSQMQCLSKGHNLGGVTLGHAPKNKKNEIWFTNYVDGGEENSLVFQFK